MMWKNNVIIQDQSHQVYGHLEEVWEDKAVYLNLFGQEVEPLFNYVFNAIKRLNRELKDTKLLSQLNLVRKGWYKGDWTSFADFERFKIDFFNQQTESLIENNSMDQIQKLISQGRLEMALEELSKILPNHLKGNVIPLQEKRYKLKMDNMSGAVDRRELEQRRNKLVMDVLALNGMKNDPPPKIDETPPISENNNIPPSQDDRAKILFLAASPNDQAGLQVGYEFRTIRTRLNQASNRDAFEVLMPEVSVTIENMIKAMNQKPKIVHFAGHGEEEGIMIATENNESQLMPLKAIKRLFRRFKDQIDLVILNSCFSSAQAKVISEFDIYVIGMNAPMEDGAAVNFAGGLYVGLGEGKSVEDAYDDAMIVIETKNPKFADLPEVWKNGEKLDL